MISAIKSGVSWNVLVLEKTAIHTSTNFLTIGWKIQSSFFAYQYHINPGTNRSMNAVPQTIKKSFGWYENVSGIVKRSKKLTCRYMVADKWNCVTLIRT